MNEKGLTLVELLAVIIILSLIALIVTPNIARSIKEYRERLYEVQLSEIKESAKNWLADQINNGNKSSIPTEGNSVNVSVSTLQNGGYVDPELKDPRTKQPISGTTFVTIEFKENQYIYTINE